MRILLHTSLSLSPVHFREQSYSLIDLIFVNQNVITTIVDNHFYS
jgi:hypothetical protein